MAGHAGVPCGTALTPKASYSWLDQGKYLTQAQPNPGLAKDIGWTPPKILP